MERINAIFGNTQNLVFSQLESTTISLEHPLINFPFQPKSRKEHWDFTPSPKREKLGCALFDNPLKMGDHEEGHNVEEEVE